MQEANLPIPLNTISVKDAAGYTANWRELWGAFIHPENILRAFYFSLSDIKNIADMNNVAGVRVYVGLKDIHDASSVKLIMVPVSENEGNPDILYLLGGSADPESPTTIYDFTKPCPSFCDVNSPLYDNQGK